MAILFDKLGIDTHDVLAAAGTKWNFLRFTPGLVGGHCIGVDPYYLTHKAQQVGHHPEIILAGRRINDSMGPWVASQMVKHMSKAGISINGAKVLILGLTFKENTPDLRNTRVVDIVSELEGYGIDVDVHDPWSDPAEAAQEYGIELVEHPADEAYDGVILAVAHNQFKERVEAIRAYLRPAGVLYDLKGVWGEDHLALRL